MPNTGLFFSSALQHDKNGGGTDRLPQARPVVEENNRQRSEEETDSLVSKIWYTTCTPP